MISTSYIVGCLVLIAERNLVLYHVKREEGNITAIIGTSPTKKGLYQLVLMLAHGVS